MAHLAKGGVRGPCDCRPKIYLRCKATSHSSALGNKPPRSVARFTSAPPLNADRRLRSGMCQNRTFQAVLLSLIALALA